MLGRFVTPPSLALAFFSRSTRLLSTSISLFSPLDSATATAAAAAAAKTTTTTTTTSSKPKGKSKTPPKNLQLPPLPQLVDEDLEEEFMRGRGPGGQVINKSSILVSLLHVPSGTRVKCQDSRSRETNRLLARRRMQEKLDTLWNGAESRAEMKRELVRSRKAAKKRKGRRQARDNTEEDGGEETIETREGDDGGAHAALKGSS